jgi:CRISPR-associated protein Cst2
MKLLSDSRELTHIAGTILIEAPASFLNGAGLEQGEDQNVSTPKFFRDGSSEIPYVSAQAWRRWLRNTLIEETGWPSSELRAVGYTKKGSVNQIASELNPIDFAEDDIFGYMMAKGSRPKEKGEETEEEEEEETEEKVKVKSVMRASPFISSLLFSIRKIKSRPRDEGFVHLKEGTPLPYSTRFYRTHLQAIFSLNYARLGVFANVGDRIELDDQKVSSFLSSGKIVVHKDLQQHGKIYKMVEQSERKRRTRELLSSLAKLRGGAKQAQFGTDVSPKVMILAGLSCGNPIFNQLFKDSEEGPMLHIERIKEIVEDYSDRIVSPVFIGLRTGYLQNENEIRALEGLKVKDTSFRLGTPIDVAREMGNKLP